MCYNFLSKMITSMVVLIPHARSVRSVRAQTLRVPVGDAGDGAVVETGTVVMLLYPLRATVRTSRAQRVVVEINVKMLRYGRQKNVDFPNVIPRFLIS